MNKTKRFMTVFLIALMSLVVLAPANVNAAGKAKISPTKKTMYVGDTCKIKLSNNKKKVKWSASNSNIKITKKTKSYVNIKGVKSGTATLRAKVGKKTYKCKVTVKKKPELESKSKTITVDNSTTVKISNASKVKWSTSDGKIKITKKTNKYATIKGVKAGTSYLNAKVDGKTYKCKITVNAKKTTVTNTTVTKPQAPTSDKISYELYRTSNGVVGIFTNNNSCDVSMETTLIYYKDGVMIDTSTEDNYALEKGKTCALRYAPPYDADYNQVGYDEYKISISVKDASNDYICKTDEITANDSIGADKVVIEVKNNSGINLSYIEIAVVFYGGNNEVIGYEYNDAECLNAGSVDYKTFDFPYDINYDTITPKSYRVFINHAYTYSWMQ